MRGKETFFEKPTANLTSLGLEFFIGFVKTAEEIIVSLPALSRR